MADGPDIGLQMAQMQSLLASSRGASGGLFLGGIIRDVEISSTALNGPAPAKNNLPAYRGSGDGPLAKIFKILSEMGFSADQIRKGMEDVNKSGPSTVGSIADITGSSHGLGGFGAGGGSMSLE